LGGWKDPIAFVGANREVCVGLVCVDMVRA